MADTNSAAEYDAVAKARRIAEDDTAAGSPDERSVPYYLQSIALSLADIAQSLRNMEVRR